MSASSASTAGKVRPLAEAVEWRRSRPGSVVFTNGVFDLLHPGHTRYLQAARAEGDALIVAVNSDRSVRGNKGPSRPIVPEQERAELIGALECVTAAIIFDDPTPAEIVRAINPHVLVKGADLSSDRNASDEVCPITSGVRADPPSQ